MKKSFWQRLKEVGPGAIVAAAFIGPGTVTSCFTSGASYGTTLLWAILFSTLSVIIMQSMASRLGIVTQKGLGEALRAKFTGAGSRIFLAILVIAAVFVGNVAYETGNISGSILGIQAISPVLDTNTWKYILAGIIGVVAFILLFSGSYKYIEKFLTMLVREQFSHLDILQGAVILYGNSQYFSHSTFLPKIFTLSPVESHGL